MLATYLMAPHITNLAAKSLNPIIGAALARRGFSLLASRRAFTMAGFSLAATSLGCAILLKSSVLALSLIHI